MGLGVLTLASQAAHQRAELTWRARRHELLEERLAHVRVRVRVRARGVGLGFRLWLGLGLG